MKTTALDYRVIIEKEAAEGKNKVVYNAYCPTLGLADYGKTIDQALSRIKDLIEFHVESLVEEGQRVAVEKEMTTVITSVEVSTPPNFRFNYV